MPMVSMAHDVLERTGAARLPRSLTQGCSPAMGHATLMIQSYHDSPGDAGWVLHGYPTLTKRRPRPDFAHPSCGGCVS
jgi:hypothetical protein